jgi:hypothetical protein
MIDACTRHWRILERRARELRAETDSRSNWRERNAAQQRAFKEMREIQKYRKLLEAAKKKAPAGR